MSAFFFPARLGGLLLTLLPVIAIAGPGTSPPTSRQQQADVRETPAWWYRTGALRAAGHDARAGQARNVIVFLGDGMSLTTVAAARILEGQRQGGPGEDHQLSWEGFAHTALAKTYNTDAQTPDSAGTMTAIATGVKTHMGAVGVSAGQRGDCTHIDSRRLTGWLQLAADAGMGTGIVTTARITHATPAALYAHSPERNWEADGDLPAAAMALGCRDIARQLIHAPEGRMPDVILGGGRAQFLPTTQADPGQPHLAGVRTDGRDLIAEWQARHPEGAWVWNTAQFTRATDAGVPRLLGLFAHDHMAFEHDRRRDAEGAPSLAQMTQAAIDLLARQPQGFVLLVEAARIDHAHHQGNAYRALDETIALSDAVRVALQATDPDDTLILVTADHAHTLSFVGFPERGNPILGLVHGMGNRGDVPGQPSLDATGRPFTTLSYANGPGHTGPSNLQPAGPKRFPHRPTTQGPASGRPDLHNVDTTHPDYLQEALVPIYSESHGGDDVGVWATGPGSHAVRGTLEQHVLHHIIVQATPRLRTQACRMGRCDAQGLPVHLTPDLPAHGNRPPDR